LAQEPLIPFPEGPTEAGGVNLTAGIVGDTVGLIQALAESPLLPRIGKALAGLDVKPGMELAASLPELCLWVNLTKLQVPVFSTPSFHLWSEDQRFGGYVGTERLNASIGLTIVVEELVPGSPPVSLDLTLNLNAEHAKLSGETWLYLSQQLLHDSMFVSQLPGCVLRNISILGADLSYQKALLSVDLHAKDSSFQGGLFSLLDRLNAIFVQAYGPSVPRILSHVLSNHVPEALTSRLQETLLNGTDSVATCQETAQKVASSPHIFEYDTLYPPNWLVFAPCLAVALALGIVAVILAAKRGNTLGGVGSMFMLVSMALFMGGAASTQAWVWGAAIDEEVSLSTPPLMIFSFESLFLANWNAQAYINALGLMLIGLVLPLLRAVVMLFLFWRKKTPTPSSFASAVEFYGKVGGFVNTDGAIVKVAFSLIIPIWGLLQVSVIMYPAAGFYLFMSAHLTSLVGGSLLLFAMRTFAESRVYARPLAPTLSLSMLMRVILLLILAFGTGLIVASLVVPCVRLQMGGLANEMLALVGNEPPVMDVSVVELLTRLQFNVPARWGLAGIITGEVVLGILGVAFVILLPLTLFLALFWLQPSPWLLLLCEVTRSFSGLEAWVLVLVAAYLSIELLGSFIVGPHCVLIDPVLQAFPSVFPASNGVCFSMSATPLNGLYFMIGGMVIITMLSVFVVSAMIHLLYGKNSEPPRWMRFAVRKGMMKIAEEKSEVKYDMLINAADHLSFSYPEGVE
jgi:hypothetical protein